MVAASPSMKPDPRKVVAEEVAPEEVEAAMAVAGAATAAAVVTNYVPGIIPRASFDGRGYFIFANGQRRKSQHP